MRKAHETLGRIAAGERVCLDLQAPDVRAVQRQFKALGIAAIPLKTPRVSIADVRRSFGLSQEEFARRFGFELRTLRNWEQGRNKPDPAIEVLLAVIEKHPEIIDDVMSG